MAKLSSDGKYVVVEKGDTLSEIAQKYAGGASNYKKLAAINGISNADRIYVGQKIYLSGSGSGSSSSTSSSNKVKIRQFGLQSNTERTLFATWDWSKHSQTDHYRVRWLYGTGDNEAFVGRDTNITEKQDLYDIPEKASTRIIFKVLPVSKTKKDANGKETTYWTASWSDELYYYINELAPETPPTPSEPEIDGNKLTVRVDGVGDLNATHIQFQIIKNDTAAYKIGTSKIVTGSASFSCTVPSGATYKVNCRAVRDGKYSDWSAYTTNKGTAPAASAGITVIKAMSETEVHLEWVAAASATKYDVEWTTEKRYFDSASSEVQSTEISRKGITHAEITGLTSGEEYFFRVRAKNDENAVSEWTAPRSIVIGKKPSPPTTWSSTTTAIEGEDVTLFWVHNTEDNSSQTAARLRVYVNGVLQNIPDKTYSEDDEDKATGSHVISTAGLSDATILWQVSTKGIVNEWSEYSTQRTINVYKQPTFDELKVANEYGTSLSTITEFPFYISASSSTTKQKPIGYHVTITSNEQYETIDEIGNLKTVNVGEEVYSRFFDTSEDLDVIFDAGNIDLHNNISYSVVCVMSMDSGLTADNYDSPLIFTVSWDELQYVPNAEIAYDKDSIVTHIRPYCENRIFTNRQVTLSGTRYIKSSTTLDFVYQDRTLTGEYTTTGEQVYVGITGDGEEVYYCEHEEINSVGDVWLSVYRREFDGSFTELIKDLDGSDNTFITDPHPALDYARYRIVAKDKTTGSISFYDLPGYPTGEKSVVIQWDEAWSNFEATTDDPLKQPPWAGSMLKLPYNIDVSDKNALDVALVEYIGRKRPVSYYGTQLGETATWNTAIPKTDKETLYALRRLSIWTGDVYVREPSGSGYWANIAVSFDQKHLATTIPVTLELTRVEGGI